LQLKWTGRVNWLVLRSSVYVEFYVFLRRFRHYNNDNNNPIYITPSAELHKQLTDIGYTRVKPRHPARRYNFAKY